MTGTHTQYPVYSRITFALLEDSGWYTPNYDMAQPLKWGRSLGCDFAKKSCKDWIDLRKRRNESIHPFCDKVKLDPLETECTDNRDALALCNLIEYKAPLSDQYQNFDRLDNISVDALSRFGGSVMLADYCPYIQEFTWRVDERVVRGSQCQYAINNPPTEKNFALEHYGSQSKCFNHGRRMWEEGSCSHVRQWQHWGSGCYQYECRDGRLHLIVANMTYTCYYRNQEIEIQRYANNWLHIGSISKATCFTRSITC
jgi:leishmanolysin-like peptidase